MTKYIFILLFIGSLFTNSFAMDADPGFEEDVLKTSSSNKESSKPHNQNQISLPKNIFETFNLSLDQYYYAFKGTKPANGDIYDFEDVSLNMQLLTLKYKYSPTLSFNLIGAFINNYAETYFNEAIPNFLFKDRTKGFGDTLLKSTKLFILPDTSLLILEAGLSLPTGSIDEKSQYDPNGVINYPYNMQLGSGTLDPVLSAIYMRHYNYKHQVGALAFAKIRTGRNSNEYRLGNEYISSLWYSYLWKTYLTPMAKLSVKHNDGQNGYDPTIGSPDTVHAMRFYHHSRDYFDLTFSLNSKVPLTKHLKLQAMLALPVWQEFINYDDIELEARWYGMVGLVVE